MQFILLAEDNHCRNNENLAAAIKKYHETYTKIETKLNGDSKFSKSNLFEWS